MDRFRDRWPMSMLVSRARLFSLEDKNKPRDVLAALSDGKGKGGVAILAEVSHFWIAQQWRDYGLDFLVLLHVLNVHRHSLSCGKKCSDICRPMPEF